MKQLFCLLAVALLHLSFFCDVVWLRENGPHPKSGEGISRLFWSVTNVPGKAYYNEFYGS